MRITGLSLIILLFIAACAPSKPTTPPPAPTATVSATPLVPDTGATPSAPLSQRVKLVPIPFEERGESPRYLIRAAIPALTGAEDPRIETFNALAKGEMMQAIGSFRESLKYAPTTPVSEGSLFDAGYNLLSPPGDVLSLEFEMYDREAGALHPYHFTRSLTFDLERGQEITLDLLFEPDSSYLQFLSDYCRAELAARPIAFDPDSGGADPLPENFHTWNLTGEGLQITFDENQVAPYTDGPQVVLIPYSNLLVVMDPAGPLAPFIH